MNVLIVADGDVPTRAAVDRLLGAQGAQLVIGADGGALRAHALGFRVDVVVGDADSLGSADADLLRASGADVVLYPVAKDESDTELAMREALARGATAILIVGAFGGSRLEHTIANVLLLALPDATTCDVRLADDASEVRLLNGGATLTVSGQRGDFVSLFPLTAVVEGVTTNGLDFALTDEALTQGPARGLSNVLSGERATVSARTGRLLVVHTRLER